MSERYRTQSLDTDPRIERRLFEAYRRMSPADKIARIGKLRENIHEWARAGIRSEWPDADEATVRRKLATRILGEELARRVDEVARERGLKL